MAKGTLLRPTCTHPPMGPVASPWSAWHWLSRTSSNQRQNAQTTAVVALGSYISGQFGYQMIMHDKFDQFKFHDRFTYLLNKTVVKRCQAITTAQDSCNTYPWQVIYTSRWYYSRITINCRMTNSKAVRSTYQLTRFLTILPSLDGRLTCIRTDFRLLRLHNLAGMCSLVPCTKRSPIC